MTDIRPVEPDEIAPLDVLALAITQAVRLGMTKLVLFRDAGGWHAIRHVEGCNPVGRISHSPVDATLHALGAAYGVKHIAPDPLTENQNARKRLAAAMKGLTDG